MKESVVYCYISRLCCVCGVQVSRGECAVHIHVWLGCKMLTLTVLNVPMLDFHRANKRDFEVTSDPRVRHDTFRSQELCESRGGRPGPQSLISLRFLWM